MLQYEKLAWVIARSRRYMSTILFSRTAFDRPALALQESDIMVETTFARISLKYNSDLLASGDHLRTQSTGDAAGQK